MNQEQNGGSREQGKSRCQGNLKNRRTGRLISTTERTGEQAEQGKQGEQREQRTGERIEQRTGEQENGENRRTERARKNGENRRTKTERTGEQGEQENGYCHSLTFINVG